MTEHWCQGFGLGSNHFLDVQNPLMFRRTKERTPYFRVSPRRQVCLGKVCGEQCSTMAETHGTRKSHSISTVRPLHQLLSQGTLLLCKMECGAHIFFAFYIFTMATYFIFFLPKTEAVLTEELDTLLYSSTLKVSALTSARLTPLNSPVSRASDGSSCLSNGRSCLSNGRS